MQTKLLLTAISLFVILIILNIGYYKDWVQSKPLHYWNEFLNQKDDDASLEDIRKSRYGLPYVISMKVKDFMEKKGATDRVILMEPNSYYQDAQHLKLRMPEPAVFYYYTGLRAVWMNEPWEVVSQARYLLQIDKKRGITLNVIKSPEQLRQILNAYKNFPPLL